MKKKEKISLDDKKEWISYTSKLNDIYDKEIDIGKNFKSQKIKVVDLHGFSLEKANKIIKDIILNSSEKNYKKIKVITGKGIRSRVEENPYISRELGILKNSIPEFIKNNSDLFNKIKKMKPGGSKSGGIGVLYILLK